MSLEIEATYENGILKLNQQLPLENGQRVKLTIHTPGGRAKASAGMFRWHGLDASRLNRACVTPFASIK